MQRLIPVSRGLRHRLVRIVVAVSLLATGAVVGVAGVSSATTGATKLVITNSPGTTAQSGLAVSPGPQVTIEDSSGSPVLISDTILATISPTTGGANLTTAGSSVAASASTGIATFSSLIANAPVGNYTITFTDQTQTLATTSMPLAVTVGPASQLVITQQPAIGEITSTPLVRQPIVKVEDSGGNVVTSASGTMAANSSSGCAVTAGSPATIASGVATFSGLTMTGTTKTNCVVTFSTSSPSLSALSNNVLMSGTPTTLVITQQPAATGFSGAALSTQPQITLKDGSGTPVYGAGPTAITATISAPYNVYSVSNPAATTLYGVASFANLALNAPAGTYTLTFSATNYTSEVSAAITISAGAPAKLVILTQPSTTVQSGVTLAQQPIVAVEDSGGNIVTSSNLTVTATFTAGGVSLNNFNATAANGQAAFSGLALNALAGPYTLTFSAAGLTSAVSNTITVSVGPATTLVITTQPSTTVATGVAFAQQPVVKIEDSGGNVVTSNYSTVTASLTTGTGTLAHNTANAVAGTATFNGLAVTAAVGTYTLTFSDSGFSSVVSTSFSISSGPATKLVITTAPSSTALSGVALSVQPVLTVEDAAGNVVTSDTSTVTARITNGGVSLTNGAKTAVNGVAIFSGLAINASVGTYTLTFTDGNLTAAVTGYIAVSAGPATGLAVTVEPSQLSASGVALTTQPVVKVVDSGGNVITSVNSGQITAAVGSGVGGAVTSGALANISYGVATFSGLAITGISGGQYQLVFTGAGFSVLDRTKITIGLVQAPLSVIKLKGWLGRSLTLATSGGSGTGALTYSVTNAGTAGCVVTGDVLAYTHLGTCVVVATKAASGNYQPISSGGAVITIALLPKPPVLTLGFNRFATGLNANQARAIAVLASRLTTRSLVRIVAFAPRSVAMARTRGLVVERFLRARLHVRVQLVLVAHTSANMVRLITLAQ